MVAFDAGDGRQVGPGAAVEEPFDGCNPETGEYQAVPRHNEINERLARRIIKQLSKPRE